MQGQRVMAKGGDEKHKDEESGNINVHELMSETGKGKKVKREKKESEGRGQAEEGRNKRRIGETQGEKKGQKKGEGKG
ncbi:hypothetical protein Pmani_037960 [Petrolisthes manimaculis]|uniref:Uncharacterized protein n=1 Tax=Petrolisthes manimaculis TaxID=1843537 RepID=A0AAE1TKX7_9EUCA|nr:hypothetical protein Pmani_037960 [Petrolisthes manimaculis]